MCVCAYIFVSVYTNVVHVSVYIVVYVVCIIHVSVNHSHIHGFFQIIKNSNYIYMAPCKYMESCKCHVLGFRRHGGWLLGAIASHCQGAATIPSLLSFQL